MQYKRWVAKHGIAIPEEESLGFSETEDERWTTRQRTNLLNMKMKRKRIAVFLNGLRNGLSENKYLRKLRGLRRYSRCSMTDDTQIAIEACCQATAGFSPRSVGASSF